jgi:hypothetical protein
MAATKVRMATAHYRHAICQRKTPGPGQVLLKLAGGASVAAET